MYLLKIYSEVSALSEKANYMIGEETQLSE